MIRKFIDAVFAGLSISIGALLYLTCTDKVFGAIFFSVGLYTVLWFGFNLYTGKVGYVRKWKEIPLMLFYILGNAVGCLVLFLFPEIRTDMFEAKLAFPWYTVLAKSVICGILISIAVEQFKRENAWAVLIAVPAFILCGAEHSIADIGYMILTRTFTLEAFGFLALVLVGNAVGSLLIGLWVDYRKKKEEAAKQPERDEVAGQPEQPEQPEQTKQLERTEPTERAEQPKETEKAE